LHLGNTSHTLTEEDLRKLAKNTEGCVYCSWVKWHKLVQKSDFRLRKVHSMCVRQRNSNFLWSSECALNFLKVGHYTKICILYEMSCLESATLFWGGVKFYLFAV
jgi:hypothetical protein